MSITDKENELVESFAIYDDWMEKYEYIIELGKDLPMIDAANKTDVNIIKGCQSTVWLHAEKKDDKVIFTADADAIIAKGIIAILVDVLSNETPDTIIEAKLDFVKEIGLQEHLSPTRSNGLVAMVKQMKMYALALNMK
ncbi:MAG: cysteine desulfuration protein SufE [Crocinitomix sp.]|jgi:cysteine desulfuration protein SufE